MVKNRLTEEMRLLTSVTPIELVSQSSLSNAAISLFPKADKDQFEIASAIGASELELGRGWGETKGGLWGCSLPAPWLVYVGRARSARCQ